MAADRLIQPDPLAGENPETSIRPLSLAEFTGQRQARENLSIFIAAAKARAEAFTAVAAAVQKAGPDAKVEQLIMMGLKELSA